MESQDWKRIEELFHGAMELPTEKRAEFLAEACGENPDLRAEVESYLAAYDANPGLIEEPVYDLGLKILSGSEAPISLEGEQIGTFRIQRLLGEGGMGAVYQAQDTGLNRLVALKFLSATMLMSPSARHQLRREAQAVALFNHPNICQIYGFEEKDGHSFIVMPYVPGETLYSLLQKGPLSGERCAQIAHQIAGALAEAHSLEIVHRDIKPKNIMISADDQVKVLDFGLAMTAPMMGAETDGKEPRNTGQTILGGTAGYMSPEQIRREKLDRRTDIFSFGIVLYEMLAGENPFARETQPGGEPAVLSIDPPDPPGAPAGLTKITRKCLNKDRAQRYQSFDEILIDLEAYLAKTRKVHRRPLFARMRTRVALVVLLLAVIAGAIAYSALTRVRTLAVLPVINATGDQDIDYLANGLTDTVIQGLSRLQRLHVLQRTQVAMYKSASRDPVAIGRSLNREYVAAAEILKRDARQVLESRLIRTNDGAIVWKDERDLDPSELLSTHTAICNAIARNAVLFLRESERSRMFAHQTQHPEAFRYYLEARNYWNNRTKESISKASEYYFKALALDRNYLQVFTGLADCYAIRITVAWGSVKVAEAMELAKDYAMRALDRDSTIADAHASLGIVKLRYDRDYDGAENEFKMALSLDPEYSYAHYWYSNLLALRGRTAESIAHSKRALELDPQTLQNEINVAVAYYYARQYEDAVEQLHKILEKRPDNLNATYLLGLTLIQQRAYDRAIALLTPFYPKNKALFAAPLGFAHAKKGQMELSRKFQAELEEMYPSGKDESVLQEKAIFHMAMNNLDEAFGLLQKACQIQFAPFTFIKVDPLFDDLRSDPRYNELMRCAKLS